jgi:uncharacterized membrane protein YphA (DoxX/SURF4 family)
MKHISLLTSARWLFAAGVVGLGLLSLFSGDFALNWQPVPNWLPARDILARISGLLLCCGGIGMLLTRLAIPSALTMAIYWLLSALLIHAPRAFQHPLDVGSWLGCAENLLVACGAWIIFRSLTAFPLESLTAARVVASIAYIILGVSHFRYFAITAGMVPPWIPGHPFFAGLTGAGHLAAGIALLAGVIPRLAGRLEAAMITSFVLLLHLPGALQQPGSRLQWTMVFIASAMAASAWAVSDTARAYSWFRGTEILVTRRRRPQAATTS